MSEDITATWKAVSAVIWRNIKTISARASSKKFQVQGWIIIMWRIDQFVLCWSVVILSTPRNCPFHFLMNSFIQPPACLQCFWDIPAILFSFLNFILENEILQAADQRFEKPGWKNEGKTLADRKHNDMKAAYITDHHLHISMKIQGKCITAPFLLGLLTIWGGRQAASTRPHTSETQETDKIGFQVRYNETFKRIQWMDAPKYLNWRQG